MSGADAQRLSAIHVPALDGIRGLAILLVIPHNTSLMLGAAFHGAGYVAKEFMLVGWTGVQLFFVLSGFLISGALLDTQRSGNYYRTFYARRALRILPLYYGVLVLAFIVLAPLQMMKADTLATQHNQVWLWTFLSNWTDPIGWSVRGFEHFWSLAVEEQFYLLWPVLLHRMRPRRVLTLCLALCAAALAIRVGMRIAGSTPDRIYAFTVCRMDALAMGAAAAALLRMPSWSTRLQKWWPLLPWVAIAILGSGALLTHDFQRTGAATQTFGLSALAVAFALLVLAASRAPAVSPGWFARLLSFAPLRWAGKYSFAMYIFHYPIHRLLEAQLFDTTVLRVGSAAAAVVHALVVTLVSFAVAWASFHLYEKQFLRLKRHFAPSAAALAANA